MKHRRGEVREHKSAIYSVCYMFSKDTNDKALILIGSYAPAIYHSWSTPEQGLKMKMVLYTK